MQEAPRGVVCLVAAPRAEIAADPRPGVQPAERPNGRVLGQVLGDGHASQGIVGGETLVQVVEEVPSVARVVFPGVFAVQGDGYKGGSLPGRAPVLRLRTVADLAQPA